MQIGTYKGLPVIHANHMVDNFASYYEGFGKIFVSDQFMNWESEKEKDYYLEHEYEHYFWHDVIPKDLKERYHAIWKIVSNPSTEVLELLNRRLGTDYTENKYVSSYAERGGYKEDWAECGRAILAREKEGVTKKYGDYRDTKLLIKKSITSKILNNI